MAPEILEKTGDVAAAQEYFTTKMAFTTGPAELERAMANDEVLVVDVRAAEDFAQGHIPGSISLPRASWGETSKLATEKTNVLVCYSVVCHLAAHAAMEFSRQGFVVMELDGGMAEWSQHGSLVES